MVLANLIKKSVMGGTLMGLSLFSQTAQAITWDFSYTVQDGGVFTGQYITDGTSPAATDTVYNVTGISGTIAKGGNSVAIAGLDNSLGGNNKFKWDGSEIGVAGFGIEFSDTNGGVYRTHLVSQETANLRNKSRRKQRWILVVA